MPNLNEIEESVEFDTAMYWAVDREYEMRFIRYELYLGGGMTGAMKRAAEAFRRALVGVNADTSASDAKLP